MPSLHFQAGCARVDITPNKFPVLVNGDFFERWVSVVDDPLSVKALVLDDSRTRLALAVVDSCLLPAEMLDKVKASVEKLTGIPSERIMISATHCHSAPSVMSVLGSGVDQDYAVELPGKIVDAIVRANLSLENAELGYAADADPENVFCRRFIMKPGCAWSENRDFTGSPDDIAQMNPEGKEDEIVCPTGRPDPTVSILALRKSDGSPLAVFGNYSTHYAGAENISADYFAVFAERIASLVGAGEDFVGIMSNGTSGDANCIDFRNPERRFDRFTVGESVAQAGYRAYQNIRYAKDLSVDMVEKTLELGIRKPTPEQVRSAREHLRRSGLTEQSLPKTRDDVYARETLLLDATAETRTLKLQAIRIGRLGIVAIPCEVYTTTGRELRAVSPLERTFVVSCANGAFGYIPPEEAFPLGGYTTWRARSSLLEEGAERKIRLTALAMLEQLASP